jgi:hypothetical protein
MHQQCMHDALCGADGIRQFSILVPVRVPASGDTCVLTHVRASWQLELPQGAR